MLGNDAGLDLDALRIKLPDIVSNIHRIIQGDIKIRTALVTGKSITTELHSITKMLLPFGFLGAPEHGCRRAVWTHSSKKIVVKVPYALYDEEEPKHPTNKELSYLNQLPERIQFLFPRTEHIGEGVILQEYCPTNEDDYYGQFSDGRLGGLWEVTRILGISDVCEFNVGWRGEKPVFLDWEYARVSPWEDWEKLADRILDVIKNVKQKEVRSLF